MSMMWGDSEGAYSLTSSDDLSKCLYQTTGPAHIPYNDSRWQQLLLHYDRLVHLHSATVSTHDDDVVGTACAQCAKYSATSSNLAALTLHISRMLRDLQSDLEHYSNNSNENGESSSKHRITIIGKARATCGALNLLRLLSHETIVQACDGARAQGQRDASTTKQEGQPTAGNDTNYLLKESFTYRSRQSSGSGDQENDAAVQIISSIMLFLSTVGAAATNTSEIISIPEIYDVIVQTLSLLLVLLSTQLYQPMVSSAEAAESDIPHGNFFLDKFMEYSSWQRQNYRAQQQQQHDNVGVNEPMALLSAWLNFLVERPAPPRRSIASHYVELTKAVAQQMTDLVLSNDGMYEDSCIVMAAAPQNEQNDASVSTSPLRKISDDAAITNNLTTVALGTDDSVALSSKGHNTTDVSSFKKRSIVLQPIRSILLLSSTVLLLPIRLVRLAFAVLGRKEHAILPEDVSKDDHTLFQQIQTNCEKSSWNKTNNILLLTDSPIADLSTALILLVSNNYRAHSVNGRSALRNPFRVELASLNDTRWGKDDASRQSDGSLQPMSSNVGDSQATSLSINFESLFKAFGRISHTELGALTLYTMLLSSPIFAESVAAKSDLDLVIIPLLRSLYFSSVMKHNNLYQKKGPSVQKTPFQQLSQTDKPYRSQSQLYVILILLLIFSQDPSFGRDSFRRVSIPEVKWYKERQIKSISLGSMILVVLLRVITFNLNMLHDEFLLSNCIAVLLNLSPHIVQLHKYVATRITFVTVSCFKRYLVLLAENGGIPEEEGDLSSTLGMHGEVSQSRQVLLIFRFLRHSFTLSRLPL